jgi:hypothetical protein
MLEATKTPFLRQRRRAYAQAWQTPVDPEYIGQALVSKRSSLAAPQILHNCVNVDPLANQIYCFALDRDDAPGLSTEFQHRSGPEAKLFRSGWHGHLVAPGQSGLYSPCMKVCKKARNSHARVRPELCPFRPAHAAIGGFTRWSRFAYLQRRLWRADREMGVCTCSHSNSHIDTPIYAQSLRFRKCRRALTI